MAALRSLEPERHPTPRKRRPAWMDDVDRGDARVRDEDWREHLDWQREHDRERALYGDRDLEREVGWGRDAA